MKALKSATATVFVVLGAGLGALRCPAAFADANSPGTVPGGLDPGLLLRGFANHGDFSLAAEAFALSESDSRQLKELTVGGYYQPLEELKLGAFYRRAYGLRHDEDWAFNAGAGQWTWNGTNSRGENILILDASPRALLAENWVGELKLRYLNDTFDHEQTLVVRPGLTYFVMREDHPWWSFFFQVELDIPLNFGSQAFSERWVYLGALHHFTDSLAIGAFGALDWETWSTAPAYLARGGSPYEVSATSEVLALTAIWRTDF